MRRLKLEVREKGQVTIPVDIRRLWNLGKGSELSISFNERYATIRPVGKVSVKESSGALGVGKDDEVEFATLDPELIPLYYEKRYGRGEWVREGR